MSEQNVNLRPLWDAILNVYSEFEKICNRHDIRFYAAYGTALGAVRHKGFIPWDDDFDVEMPRSDYDRFLEIAESELPTGYKLKTWRNTENYNNMFAKVVLDNPDRTASIENEMGCALPEGIFIDLFPIDGLPSSSIKRLWRLLRRGLLKVKSQMLFPDESLNRTLRFKFGRLLVPIACLVYREIRSKKDFLDAHEQVLREDSYETSPFVHELGWIMNEWRAYKNRMPYSSSVYGTPRLLPFEGIDIPVHEHVEEHLRYEFGDYMSLPPKEKQKPAHLRSK